LPEGVNLLASGFEGLGGFVEQECERVKIPRSIVCVDEDGVGGGAVDL
jgi:hypothetical protein